MIEDVETLSCSQFSSLSVGKGDDTHRQQLFPHQRRWRHFRGLSHCGTVKKEAKKWVKLFMCVLTKCVVATEMFKRCLTIYSQYAISKVKAGSQILTESHNSRQEQIKALRYYWHAAFNVCNCVKTTEAAEMTSTVTAHSVKTKTHWINQDSSQLFSNIPLNLN